MSVLPQFSAAYAAAKVEAMASEKAVGLPWKVTCSQWALESGWGQHCPQNNAFGIKSYNGCYGTQKLWTKEEINGKLEPVQREFATFQTLKDCFDYHGDLIMHGIPYGEAVQGWLFSFPRTPELLMRAIGPIYATDPDYTRECLEIMAKLT